MAQRPLLFRYLRFPEISASDAQRLADEVRALVAPDLAIESVQIVRDQQNEGAVILRGRLLGPSDQIFTHWLHELNSRGYTPILRPDPSSSDANQVVLHVLAGAVPRTSTNFRTNLILFLLTVLSTLFVGSLYASTDVPINSWLDLISPSNLLRGWPYAATLLGILTAHEFGHYFAARYHRVAVTLPYFLPLPIPLGIGGGTLGAFIQLREPVPDRRKLFDIGVAGPLAGLVLAVPLLLLGLRGAPVGGLPSGQELLLEGNSLLYYFAKFLVFGRFLPDWIARQDVMLDAAPVVTAAWTGLLVTAINLLPLGQLDGGHVVFALFGDKARYVNRIILGVMFVLAVAGLGPIQRIFPFLEAVGYTGWFLWLGLTYFLVGPYHPPALDDVTQLDNRRRWLGYFVIFVFVITFTPVPVRLLQL